MDALTAYGFASVTLMLIAYELEHKARFWRLVFAFGCFATALYGYLAGTLPFAAIEIVWGFVAIRKWKKHRDDG